jgi:iron complex transport system ATP-binding protein
MLLKITDFSNQILTQITFELKSGQNLIILGSNGVGKTTLAKVLCGITPSGNVRIGNLDPSKIFGEKRAKLINYIPPKLEIFDEFMRVGEFLELGCFNHAITIDKALEILGITHLKEKTCRSLSSGESQLLLIASSLLHSANYTIFDEPTANLDPKKIQMLFSHFKESHFLQSKIIITHNLDFAYKLGFDILFLEDKRVKFHGASKDFFTQENLNKLYDKSVGKIENNIVVNL